MKFRFDGYNYIVRLEKGEQLIASLVKLIKDQNIPTCWISGIGGAERAEIGFYNMQEQKYEWRKVNEELEITNINGLISWIGQEPSLHIHGTFSRRDGSVVAGHVKESTINGTCEIFLHRWYGERLVKKMDPDLGLNLLDL